MCSKCRVEQEEAAFSLNRKRKSGRCAVCKACHRAYNAANAERNRARAKAWREEHREKARANSARWRAENPERKRAQHLLAYGLTLEAFESLWDQQCGLCGICGKALVRGRATHVDHDHETTEVRGLLCSPCNTGLGSLGDDEGGLLRALDYLRKGA